MKTNLLAKIFLLIILATPSVTFGESGCSTTPIPKIHLDIEYRTAIPRGGKGTKPVNLFMRHFDLSKKERANVESQLPSLVTSFLSRTIPFFHFTNSDHANSSRMKISFEIESISKNIELNRVYLVFHSIKTQQTYPRTLIPIPPSQTRVLIWDTGRSDMNPDNASSFLEHLSQQLEGDASLKNRLTSLLSNIPIATDGAIVLADHPHPIPKWIAAANECVNRIGRHSRLAFLQKTTPESHPSSTKATYIENFEAPNSDPQLKKWNGCLACESKEQVGGSISPTRLAKSRIYEVFVEEHQPTDPRVCAWSALASLRNPTELQLGK